MLTLILTARHPLAVEAHQEQHSPLPQSVADVPSPGVLVFGAARFHPQYTDLGRRPPDPCKEAEQAAPLGNNNCQAPVKYKEKSPVGT